MWVSTVCNVELSLYQTHAPNSDMRIGRICHVQNIIGDAFKTRPPKTWTLQHYNSYSTTRYCGIALSTPIFHIICSISVFCRHYRSSWVPPQIQILSWFVQRRDNFIRFSIVAVDVCRLQPHPPPIFVSHSPSLSCCRSSNLC